MDQQLVRLYKLMCEDKGTPVSCTYIEPGRVNIDVAVPVYGSTVTTTCTLGTNDYPWCTCSSRNYQYYCYCYDDDYDNIYECEWDDLQTEWDRKLGRRPTENWDD